MFAVEGWKLGPIVQETVTKKKNLKRKRDDKGDNNATREVKKAVVVVEENKGSGGVKKNPFTLNRGGIDVSEKVTGGHSLDKKTKKNKKSKDKESSDPAKLLEDVQPETPSEPVISKRQKARNKAEKRLQRKLEKSLTLNEAQEEPVDEHSHVQQPPPMPTSKPPMSSFTNTLTPLQQKMRAKLSGSQFRHINEKLYTTHSSEALSLFTDQPSLFHDVHIPPL